MKPFNLIVSILGVITIFSSCNSTPTTMVADNTFVHGSKVYKIIDNEIRELGDLNSDTIKKFQVFKAKTRDFGTQNLTFVKPGAKIALKVLYRGNYLYYSITLLGFNDIKSNYSTGQFTLNFLDDYGFILHSIDIPLNDLVGSVDNNNKIQFYQCTGKTEMSTDINSAIKTYEVNSSIHSIY